MLFLRYLLWVIKRKLPTPITLYRLITIHKIHHRHGCSLFSSSCAAAFIIILFWGTLLRRIFFRQLQPNGNEKRRFSDRFDCYLYIYCWLYMYYYYSVRIESVLLVFLLPFYSTEFLYYSTCSTHRLFLTSS